MTTGQKPGGAFSRARSLAGGHNAKVVRDKKQTFVVTPEYALRTLRRIWADVHGSADATTPESPPRA